MLRNKLMTACSVAVLTAALYGCSSSSDDGANTQVQDLQDQITALNAELGEGEELTPEALAALIQEKADAEAALADAMIAHQAALDQAAMEAMTAQEAALAAAAMEAMTAHEAALAAAAMEAMTAQEAALAAAAMEAMTAHEAALAAAAMEAMTAHEAALAAAAMEAMTAHEAALAAAAMDAADMAAADKAQALADAQVAADAAQVQALADAQVAADAAQVQALADAQVAADAAQVQALADAQVAADAAQVQALADAQVAADAAQVQALADAQVAADAAQVQALADAQVAADAAQVQALADAQVAADAAQVQALADAKMAADAALKLVQDELDAANIRIVEIEELAGDVLAAAALADRIAREDMIQIAIAASVTTQGTMANEFPNDITTVTATRNAADMVAVTVSDDDYTGGETTAGSGDWNGATLTNGTNTLVVYTDIEAPADKLLTAQYSRDHLDAALTFTTGDANDQREGKAQSNSFPSEPGTTWMYTGEVEDGGRAKTVDGTFDGVPGHFACEVETCTLMTDADGKLMTTDQAWRFTPMAPLTATVKEPDAAYAYFGWWLNKPDDNTAIHNVEVFAGAVGDAGASVTAAIEGTATYKGPAAGKYTTKTFSAGVQTDAGVGHFTASTTLTAKFGDDSVDAGAGTIDGMVTGFELDDGATPTWSVKLMEATLMDGDNDFNGVSDATFGPTSNVMGVWEGSFYDAANAQNDEAPGTVVGTFNADSANASLLGAFGATKQ